MGGEMKKHSNKEGEKRGERLLRIEEGFILLGRGWGWNGGMVGMVVGGRGYVVLSFWAGGRCRECKCMCVGLGLTLTQKNSFDLSQPLHKNFNCPPLPFSKKMATTCCTVHLLKVMKTTVC